MPTKKAKGGRPSDGVDDRRAEARMAVSRHAAVLFIERGVAATSGDEIAAAAGISTRTIWRYFRSKEACVEPLPAASSYRFIAPLRRWPLDMAFEDFLLEDLAAYPPTLQDLADDATAIGLISLVRDEPALRTSWLMVCAQAEQSFVPVVARRLDLPTDDFRVVLSAATSMAAVRVVHEEVAVTAVAGVRTYSVEDVVRELGKALRVSTNEPICDPRPRRALLR